VWDHLPRSVQKTIIEKHLRFYVIDAPKSRVTPAWLAHQHDLANLLFAISGLLPRDEAIRHIKESVRKTYSRKGDEVVRQNYAAVDATLVNPSRCGARERNEHVRSSSNRPRRCAPVRP